MGIKNPDGSQFTGVDYDRAYQKQSGKCAICHTHQSELKKTLAADHSHKSGLFRALLCDMCNRGIGVMQENTDYLRSAIVYLEAMQQDTTGQDQGGI